MKKILIKSFLLLFFSAYFSSYATFAQGEKDTEPPSDVDNVVAYPGDKQVTLKWDKSTDNVGVDHYSVYYGTEPVTNESGEYTNVLSTVGNANEYIVKNLENGTTYYFAMTAVDKAGNESKLYSYEQNATPVSSNDIGEDPKDDAVAPTVKFANALNLTEVKVVFSEGIKLPKESPESEFTIMNQESNEDLEVAGAIMDAQDSTKKTVILTTETQEIDVNYLLTVGLNITDMAENPIESGVEDSVTFVGKEESGEEEDSTSPEMVSATALSGTRVEIVFSEDIVFDSKEDFTVYPSEDSSAILEIVSAQYGSSEKVVVLETVDQEAGQEYVLTIENISDKSGNFIQGYKATEFFVTPEKDLSDILPPEDVTNFIAKIESNIVKLTWTASKSLDQGKNFDKIASLGKTAVNYDVKGLTAGQTYLLKLTTLDGSGNESKGAMTTVTIPATGSGLGILLLSSFALTSYIRRKKE